MKDENKFYNLHYWFNSPDSHADVDNYGRNYYACKIYKDLIVNLTDIPEEGYIVVLGSNRCVSFHILCQHFGMERCIGFDIANPSMHPKITIKDCTNLGPADDIPIAFVHNDIGSFPTTPKLKIHAQKWAARNVVEGGYFLGRNSLNVAKFDSETFMAEQGFLNIHFSAINGLIDLSALDKDCIDGHMLSKKITRIFY